MINVLASWFVSFVSDTDQSVATSRHGQTHLGQNSDIVLRLLIHIVDFVSKTNCILNALLS